MIISHNNRFVFVHIQKTAGKSLRRFLFDNFSDAEFYKGTHDFARVAFEELGKAWWSKSFSFAFVRNPWDRLVSWYSMVHKRSHRLSEEEKGTSGAYNKLWQYVHEHSSSFEEFVLNCTAAIEDHDGVKSFWFNQLDYITDKNGKVIVDFIGRYENLETDFREVARRLGVEKPALTHRNPSKHAHYSRYYTPEITEIVRARYWRDIAFFGYEFESD